MKKRIEGVIPAMVTPMKKDGRIDEDGLRKLTQLLIDSGVHGLSPIGTTGEGPKLSPEERRRVLETVVEETRGRVPVIPCTGGITTAETLRCTEEAKEMGADIVLVQPPWYYKPTEEALLDHYRTAAKHSKLPILLYNLPVAVGYGLSPRMVVKASKIKNIVGIKDSSMDMVYHQLLIDATPANFAVILGGPPVLFLLSLMVGGNATICGEANFMAKEMVSIYENFLAGNYVECRRIHSKLMKISSVVGFGFGTYPVYIKEAMNMMGLPAGYTRKPAMPLTPAEKRKLRTILQRMGLVEK